MTGLRQYQFAVLALVIAFCVLAQPALAQSHPTALAGAHQQQSSPDTNPPPPVNLYGLSQTFTQTPFALGANTDGSDRWPCFGSNSTNTDCPTIGNPSITFPTGGAALGVQNYVFSYTGCDGNAATVPPCGQTETWYEDDSNDTTDDLIYFITATQIQSGVMKYVSDSGIVDFAGANPFGSAPGVSVVIFGDQNFGTLGATGANNGNCSASFNYPVASNVQSGITYPYVIAANKTCVNPLPGLVTLSATTELGKPTYTKVTKGCINGETVCYTVKFTKKFAVVQKWNVWLE